MAKDVHTEHCCIVHGCKYGDEDCTVITKRQPQSYPCERCEGDGVDPTKATPETSIYNFKAGHYYRLKRDEAGRSPELALLYVMGFLHNDLGESIMICCIYMPTDFLPTYTIRFASSVQGVKVIKQSEWLEVSEEDFKEFKKIYTREVEVG